MWHLINRFLKRFFDIVVCCAAIIVLIPLWLLVSIAIKCDSKGPVLFAQGRLTKNGCQFKMYKFRSMVVNAESMGAGLFNYENDPRVTKVGQFLRNSSIDELPQLWNVVKGELSIVGPRPCVTYELGDYETLNIKYKKRFEVRGGITGLSQIKGRNKNSWNEKITYDNQYIELFKRQGIWLDIKIIFGTVAKVCKKKDIYEAKADDGMSDVEATKLAEKEIIRIAHLPYEEDAEIEENINERDYIMKAHVDNRFIWYKGKIINVNDAKINILSPTAQFGLNVFEGIPCYWNDDEKQLYAFRLNDHYDRLLRSARLIQINCPYTKEDFKNTLVDVVKANEYNENLSVRQTLFVDGFGSWGSAEPVDMFIAPIPKGKTNSEYNKKGLTCCVTSWRRISETTLSPRIKCGANYINSRVGQREALRNGYDTCLFLNEQGKVAEGAGSCFFMVVNGTLVTPMLTDSVLESITRDSVIKLAKANGIPVVDRTIDRTELYTCEEAFLCGSAMEITPVLSIDKYVVGKGETGIVTTELHNWYLNAAKGKDDRFKSWITPIY